MGSTKAIQDVRVYVASTVAADVTGDPGELTASLVVQDINRQAGGEALDHANFLYDLAQTGEKLRNLQTPMGFSRKVEVRFYTGEEVTTGEGEEAVTQDEFKLLFWGDLTRQRIAAVAGQGESVAVSAAIYHYHFGGPCRGPRYYDPYGEEGSRYVDVWEELEFNPLIDGLIEENMADAVHDPNEDVDGYHLWADPESYRTTGAEAIQDLEGEGGRSRWTLAEAVYSLCWICNPDELWIKNPDRAVLISAAASAIPLDNMRLPFGKHLPFYLDNLLHPYGFEWEVELLQDPDPANEGLSLRRIRVFSKSTGPAKTIKMQDHGEAINLDEDTEDAEVTWTNCKGYVIDTDIGNVANEVIAVGGKKEREFDFLLFRAWPKADDALTGSDLKKSDPESAYNTGGKEDVWRRWVGCEAGDFTDLETTDEPRRVDPNSTEWLVVQDSVGLGDVPTKGVYRRRRIEHRLTRDKDKKRLPPELRYSDGTRVDPEDEESDLVWLPVPEDSWSYNILSTQIGIYFTSDEPPPELIAAGDDALLRITGTVEWDERLESTADYSADSPNGEISQLVVDVSERFFDREVDASVTIPSGATKDERDDSALLDTFAEHVRDAEKSADVRGEFVLFGVDPNYALGDVLTEIEFRNIDLSINAPESIETRYLQVTGITYRTPWETIVRATPQQVPPYYFRKPEAGDRERRRD